jgi:hypothetical protein
MNTIVSTTHIVQDSTFVTVFFDFHFLQRISMEYKDASSNARGTASLQVMDWAADAKP